MAALRVDATAVMVAMGATVDQLAALPVAHVVPGVAERPLPVPVLLARATVPVLTPLMQDHPDALRQVLLETVLPAAIGTAVATRQALRETVLQLANDAAGAIALRVVPATPAMMPIPVLQVAVPAHAVRGWAACSKASERALAGWPPGC